MGFWGFGCGLCQLGRHAVPSCATPSPGTIATSESRCTARQSPTAGRFFGYFFLKNAGNPRSYAPYDQSSAPPTELLASSYIATVAPSLLFYRSSVHQPCKGRQRHSVARLFILYLVFCEHSDIRHSTVTPPSAPTRPRRCLGRCSPWAIPEKCRLAMYVVTYF